MRRLAFLFAVMLPACGGDPPSPTPTPDPNPTPTPLPTVGYNCNNPPRFSGVVAHDGESTGKYIVVRKSRLLRKASAEEKDDFAKSSRQIAADFKAKDVTLLASGFSAALKASEAGALAAHPDVEYVQLEGYKHITVESHLDRVDQRSLPLDGVYEPGADGAGVNVAVIDTGISPHSDYEGRLASGFSAHPGGTTDGHGHGTHVSGIVAGTTYGVAKKATLYPVRVLNAWGSGTDTQVIQGVEWVAAQKRANPEQDWVANMSLGGSPAPALDQSVCDAIAEGVTFAIAAGNDGVDARNSSPARVIQALTVGAINARNDQPANFSNFGPLLDLWTGGVDVLSTWNNGGTRTLSGTSMSAPGVAGAAALYLFRQSGSTPLQVHDGLVALATPGTRKILYVKE